MSRKKEETKEHIKYKNFITHNFFSSTFLLLNQIHAIEFHHLKFSTDITECCSNQGIVVREKIKEEKNVERNSFHKFCVSTSLDSIYWADVCICGLGFYLGYSNGCVPLEFM